MRAIEKICMGTISGALFNGDGKMAFRAEEEIQRGYERALSYLVPRTAPDDERKRAEDFIEEFARRYGPVVQAYPTWHPLVPQKDPRSPVRYPGDETGYKGLDHTVYFANGFITCPYHSGASVLESVDKLQVPIFASIEAEVLDFSLYARNTTTIAVRLDWDVLDENGLIPERYALPLMMEEELKGWRGASVAETWETMRPYLLGDPHGNRSSLFVSADTALSIKRMYLAMIGTGMFGPIKIR